MENQGELTSHTQLPQEQLIGIVDKPLTVKPIRIKGCVQLDPVSLGDLATDLIDYLPVALSSERLASLNIYRDLVSNIYANRKELTDAELALEFEEASKFSIVAAKNFMQARANTLA